VYAPCAAADDAPVEDGHRHAPAAVRAPFAVRAPVPSVASGAAAGPEPAGRRNYKDDRVGGDQLDDRFDRVSLPDGAEEKFGISSIPSCVERRDGLLFPFSPDDTRQAANFAAGSREENEAQAWYQSLAWTERLSNSLHAYLFSDDEVKDAELFSLCLTARRIYTLRSARYDFFAHRQTEPALADAFAHATAVPRHNLRGSNARELRARVARAEVHASAKIGAAARGFHAPARDATGYGGGGVARRGGDGGTNGGHGGAHSSAGRRGPRVPVGGDAPVRAAARK